MNMFGVSQVVQGRRQVVKLQYGAPVRLYSLWNCLQSVVEVVAILKTLHQDLIRGFQNNDLAEIQNLKIAEF